MNTNADPDNKYSAAKTALKAAPPFIVIILANAAKAALQAAGITIDDQTIFNIALTGYAGYIALLNWIKNRKK